MVKLGHILKKMYWSIIFLFVSQIETFFHRFSGSITLEFYNILFHGQRANVNLNYKNAEVVDNTKIYFYLNYIWNFL